MPFVSTNPATSRRIARYSRHTSAQVEQIVVQAHAAFSRWREVSFSLRARLLRRVARELRGRRDVLAALITAEVGKPIAQARAEIDKSALACDYCAQHGARWLSPEQPIAAPAGARVHFEPLGVVLAIMPWNFPVWQALRAAAPALMAGNTFVMKPAPSTAGTGRALAEAFSAAGAPPGLFQTLLVEPAAVARLIADPRVSAVTLTGSTQAGQSVAAAAGAAMKPGVFELGGSDAYLIFGDADLAQAAEICAQARLVNSGQSCIAAKRFIVVRSVRREFERRLVERVSARRVGDPTNPATEVGPLARADLRDALDAQVRASVRRGARVLLGGHPLDGPGSFYAPTVLTEVRPGMPAYTEELFGPVAAIIAVRDENEAIEVANDSRYGLGAAVFTRSRRRAEHAAARLEAGAVFINDFVRSDPALPFGGVKESGYGRELGAWGLRSFVNVKTVCGR